MTFCKVLAQKERDGKTITAYEKTEKFSSIPRYEIAVSVDGYAIEVIKAARTTWQKKFNQI